MNPRLRRRSPEQKYREFLELLGAEIDRQYAGVFEWRFGKPSENVVDGLIITKADVGGYVFVVGVCQLPSSRQGGVWREGAQHTYGARIMQYREWEQQDMSHADAGQLESRCSEQPADIVEDKQRAERLNTLRPGQRRKRVENVDCPY